MRDAEAIIAASTTQPSWYSIATTFEVDYYAPCTAQNHKLFSPCIC